MLFVSGRLDPDAGGPAADDIDTPRRSLYVQTARWDRSSFAMLFDAANPDASTEKRTISTVAPQALCSSTIHFVFAQAEHLATRLAARGSGRRHGPDRAGLPAACSAGRHARKSSKSAGSFCSDPAGQGAEADWPGLAHVLLCSNEFVYLD